MYYCSLCRRHLNGALSCPGCGTPIEDLAPAPEPTAPEGRRVDPESVAAPAAGRRADRRAERDRQAAGG
ncbi:hypothetical protein AB0C51_23385, partial [Streptomyces pathocidini]|uniref:SCO2400 family protein n=1 Tax=Streptomyces pathocidini TaxID=1650571 RepID=UPI00347BA070